MNDTLHNPGLVQEDDRIPWISILLVFAVTTLIGILLVTWAWYLMHAREAVLRPSADFPERQLGPRRTVGGVLEHIYGDVGPGQALFAEQHERISRFQWVDKNRRVVAIPIDDAMTLFVESRAAQGGGPPP